MGGSSNYSFDFDFLWSLGIWQLWDGWNDGHDVQWDLWLWYDVF